MIIRAGLLSAHRTRSTFNVVSLPRNILNSNMSLFAVVSAIFSCAFGATIVWCNQLFETRQFQVSEASPGLQLCAIDAPSDSLSLDSVLDCALQCQRFKYCENFNYDSVNKICDIFFGRPKCYKPYLSCVHYQVKDVALFKINLYFSFTISI